MRARPSQVLKPANSQPGWKWHQGLATGGWLSVEMVVVLGKLDKLGLEGCEWGWRVRCFPRPPFRRARWGRGGRGVSSCWHEGSPTARLDSKGALGSKTFICCHFNIVFFSSICALNFGLMSLLPRIMSSFSSCWAFGHTPYTWYSGENASQFFSASWEALYEAQQHFHSVQRNCVRTSTHYHNHYHLGQGSQLTMPKRTHVHRRPISMTLVSTM